MPHTTRRRRASRNQPGAPTGSTNSHRVLAMTRRGTLGLLGGLLMTMAAAGCSADTGTTSALSPPPATPPATATPIPAPTPTPTTTEESARGLERPDLSQVDAATGEALALYYLQSYVEAHVTRDATVINEFAHPDCRWCASVITGVQEYVDEGWYASGGELTFSDIVTTEVSDTYFSIRVTVSQAEMLSPAGDDAAALEAAREHQRLRDAAEQAQAMAFAALAAAAEADQDAARALRQAWAAAADGSTNDAPDRELVTAVGARDLPATGASPAEVSAWWASLSAAARALALRLHPDVIGNLDGIPFDVRVAANRANITNALADTRASITDLERRLAQAQAAFDQMLASGTPDAARGAELSGEIARLDRELADARAHAEMYDRLLTEETIRFDENGEDTVGVGHQVVLFDPAQGAFAEIVGNLDANTRNIAVMVPGTGANLLNMTGPVDSAYKRCADFALADGVQPPGSLAVISWMGGPLPQHLILESPQARFAVDLGPKLAQFTDGLTNPNGVPVTVVGHSYGGSVVGAAEAAGMHVDRVLHVESAGAGPGVGGVDEYASTGTARYSMTAPGDIIGYTQGREMLDIGHGADPDQLSGVTRLETGLWEDGKPSSGLLQGKDSHSDVFTPGSTAFNNMVGVMTGGEVSLYVDAYEYAGQVPASEGPAWLYPMENPDYSPPTMDVL